MPKYGVFSDPYFPAFGLNTEKYGPEKTPYLDTFQAVILNTYLYFITTHTSCTLEVTLF